MPKQKPKRVQLVVPAEDYALWEELAKDGRASIARLVRVAIRHSDRERLTAILRDAA